MLLNAIFIKDLMTRAYNTNGCNKKDRLRDIL